MFIALNNSAVEGILVFGDVKQQKAIYRAEWPPHRSADVYYDTPPVMMGAKNGDKDLSPAHLKGKAIGVQTRTMYERYVAEHFAVSVMKTYQTQDEAFADLTAGRVEYAPVDLPAAQAFLKTSQGSTCCEVKGVLPYDAEIFGIGAAGGIREGDIELKAKLNAALKALREKGQYDKITRAYFDYSILPPQP